MPTVDGKYVAPTWVNNAQPALDAAELQAITNAVEANQYAQNIQMAPDDTTTVPEALTGKSNLTNLAPVETTSTASRSYIAGDLLIYDGVLREVTADIAEGETIEAGSNISADKVTLSEKVTQQLAGKADLVGGKVPLEQLPDDIGGLLPQAVVTTKAGASVTATLDDTVVGPVVAGEDGIATLDLPSFGTWTLTAALDEKTVSDAVEVTEVRQYELILSFARLPAGFTELKYIGFDGSKQYIDTKISPTNVTKITWRGYVSGAKQAPYYAGDNTWQGGFLIIGLNSETGGIRVAWKTRDTEVTIAVSILGENIHEIVQDGNKFYVDGILEHTFEAATFTASTTLCLFRTFSGDWPANGIMTAFSMENVDTVLCNYIPARRDSDDGVGLYDTVSGEFFTSATDTPFVAGPEADNYELLAA